MDTKSQHSKIIFKIKYNNLLSFRTRNGAKDYGKKNNHLTLRMQSNWVIYKYHGLNKAYIYIYIQ